jgi:hypothetical protein
MRLDDVPLDDLKKDNLPMQQIWQLRSKTEPTKNQLQPNSLYLIRAIFRVKRPVLPRSHVKCGQRTNDE